MSGNTFKCFKKKCLTNHLFHKYCLKDCKILLLRSHSRFACMFRIYFKRKDILCGEYLLNILRFIKNARYIFLNMRYFEVNFL